MEGLTEGRMCHYVLGPNDSERSEGQHRPAIVVRTFEGIREEGTANLIVLLDGQNDTVSGDVTAWRTSVLHDPDGKPGTWHWIERA